MRALSQRAIQKVPLKMLPDEQQHCPLFLPSVYWVDPGYFKWFPKTLLILDVNLMQDAMAQGP